MSISVCIQHKLLNSKFAFVRRFKISPFHSQIWTTLNISISVIIDQSNNRCELSIVRLKTYLGLCRVLKKLSTLWKCQYLANTVAATVQKTRFKENLTVILPGTTRAKCTMWQNEKFEIMFVDGMIMESYKFVSEIGRESSFAFRVGFVALFGEKLWHILTCKQMSEIIRANPLQWGANSYYNTI